VAHALGGPRRERRGAVFWHWPCQLSKNGYHTNGGCSALNDRTNRPETTHQYSPTLSAVASWLMSKHIVCRTLQATVGPIDDCTEAGRSDTDPTIESETAEYNTVAEFS